MQGFKVFKILIYEVRNALQFNNCDNLRRTIYREECLRRKLGLPRSEFRIQLNIYDEAFLRK